MSSRTSALRGLALTALSALAFAACESKTAGPVTPVTATLTATPAGPITLTAVGQTVTIAASPGGLTNPVVTFTSSTPGVATVNATTGVVTAVANGQTTITARATGTDNTGATQTPTAAVQVIVNIGGGSGTAPPSISIASITNNAGQAVDITNASGQINIALNVDVPTGTPVSRVETLINGVVVCSQSFSTGSVDAGVSPEGAEAPITIVCPVNTAAFDSLTNAAKTPNGQAVISARIVSPTGSFLATASQTLTLNNNNFIRATVTTSRGTATGGTNPGPGNLAPAGELWSAGNVTVTLNPVIYNGAANSIANATVSLATSGRGVTGVAGCQPTFVKATDPTIAGAQGGNGFLTANGGGGQAAGVVTPTATTPNCPIASASQTSTTPGTNGTLTVTFPEANLMTNTTATGGNGVNGVEDLINITIASVTSAGQPGPVCINPNPSSNPQNPTVIGGGVVTCGNGFAINPATGNPFTGNQLRLDNLAPRITNFDITPATLGCAPNASCYINSPATISNGFTSVDYGVDSQTAAFAFGTSAGTAPLPGSFTAANETATSGTDVASVTVVDKLNNSSGARFASTTAGNTVATATSANVQTFGIDITAPTCAFVNTPAASVVTANEINPNPATEQFAISFSDAATPPAGPSGFPTLPVSRTEVGLTPGVSTCIIGVAASACAPTSSDAVPPNPVGLVDTNPGGAGTAVPVAGAGFADAFNNTSTTNRYVTYTATVRDVAGNTCAVGSRTALYDNTAPATGGIVAPSTISGNQSVTFSASATDNLDLGSATPSEAYGAVIPNLVFPTVTLGTFGPDVFSTSATVNFTDPSFVRSIETTTATGAPSGAVQPATAVSLAVSDVAGNAAPLSTQNIAPNVIAGCATACTAGNPNSFATTNTQLRTFTLATSSATVCNGDTAGGTQTTPCPTNPSSVTLTASATGPASTFANPFTRVNFYYTTPAGATVLIGTGSVAVTDNTVTSTRTWTYTITWTPAGLAAGAYTVRAIGVDVNGSGLQSNLVPETVAVD